MELITVFFATFKQSMGKGGCRAAPPCVPPRWLKYPAGRADSHRISWYPFEQAASHVDANDGAAGVAGKEAALAL